MTIDDRTGCFEGRWPGQDDRAVVNELLNYADSPHWVACRKYVQWLVQIMARRGYYASVSKEDVVQDCMVSILIGLQGFRFECRFTTWLASIVRRRMADAARFEKRSLARECAVSLDVSAGSFEEDGERDVTAVGTTEGECLQREELREALTCLQEYLLCHAKPERNGQLLNLVLLQGYPVSDAAARLGIPPPTANYILRSVRNYLLRERK